MHSDENNKSGTILSFDAVNNVLVHQSLWYKKSKQTSVRWNVKDHRKSSEIRRFPIPENVLVDIKTTSMNKLGIKCPLVYLQV